jgi:nucleotide-binding universal stress UspA family protein
MQIRHILFPTDFSDSAQHAGRYAASLARAAGARVTIFHVLVPPQPPAEVRPSDWLDRARDLWQEEERTARGQLQAIMESPDFRGIEARPRLTTGAVEHDLLRAIVSDGPDVVVMGTHGRGLMGRAVLGGVAHKIVRLSPRPVVAVRWSGARVRTPWGKVLVGPPPREGGATFARIVVPLDGSALAEGILGEARAVGAPFGARYALVRAVERPVYPMLDVTGPQLREVDGAVRYLDTVKAGLEAEGLQAETEVLFGSPAAAILEYTEKIEADLIAMATHGRSGLSRWLLGSVAEKVLAGSGVPVLLGRAWTEAP